MRESVANAEPGKSIGFGERAREDEIGKLLEPGYAVGLESSGQIFVVRFVKNDHYILHSSQERKKVIRADQSPRRVVGIGQEDHPSAWRYRLQHRAQIMPKIL